MKSIPPKPGTERHILDTDLVRSVVESHWREMLLDTRAGGTGIGVRRVQDFQARLEAWTADMEPKDAEAFMLAVEQERNSLADLYEHDPNALYHRLGIKAQEAIPPTNVVIIRNSGCAVVLAVGALVIGGVVAGALLI